MVNNPSRPKVALPESKYVHSALYVVTPPYTNWTNYWKMDQVIEASIGVVNEEGARVIVEIYELLNGQKYYSNMVSVNVSHIENIQVIFTDAI